MSDTSRFPMLEKLNLRAGVSSLAGIVFAVLLAIFGLAVGGAPAAAQTLTGVTTCTPPTTNNNALNMCVDHHMWTAKAGQTLSGTLIQRGGRPALAALANQTMPGFAVSNPYLYGTGPGFDYTWAIPANLEPGIYSITVDSAYDPSTGCGGGGWCPYSTPGGVTFIISATPPPPTGGNVNISTAYQTRTSFTVPAAGDYTSMSVVQAPAHSSQFDYVVPNVSYTPAPGWIGTDTFTYRVNGPGGQSPVYTGTITTLAPAAPTVGNVAASTGHNQPVTFASATSGIATSLNVGSSAQGTPGVSGMNLTFAPANGFYGNATFQYSANGPGGRSADATATVTVAPPPAPTAASQTQPVGYEASAAFNLSVGGDWSSVAIVSQPGKGSVSLSGTRATYTAGGGSLGSDSFTWRATGPGGNSSIATVTMNIANPAAPGAADVSANAVYETAKNIALAPSGVYTSVAVVAQPSNGSASITGTTARYVPAAGFVGTDTFTYRASGPGGNSPTRTVTVTVSAPAAPGAANVAASTAYETATDIALQPSGVWSSLAVVAQPASGSVTITGTTARFTPAAGFYGTATWTYRAMGVGGNSNPATVTVTVGTPAAPGAGNVSASTAYETAVAIPLTPTGVWSSVEKTSDPANGSVSISGTTATYTPAAGFYGSNTFGYRATGPGGSSATRTVTVTVAVPPPPTAADTTMTTAYQTAGARVLPVSGVLTSVSVVAQPSSGSVSITGTTATYTPAAGFVGADSFTYRATGPGGSSSTQTVTVSVTAPPRPIANNLTATTAYETLVQIRWMGASSGATSGPGYVVAQPTNGKAAQGGPNLTYTPNAGFFGTDTFTWGITGPGGASTPATVTVTVAPPNAPGAANITASTPYETAADIALQPSGVWSSLAVVAQPTNGSVSITGTTARFTPSAGFFGTATWTYRAMGAGGNSDPATVTVTVGLPPAPGAANVSSSTTYETAVDIPLAPSGVWTAIQKMSDPANGAVSIAGDTATYTPAAGFYGTNTFSYRATGPGGNSPTRTVTVTVAVPPAPTAANSTLSAGFQTAGTRVLPVSGVLTSVSVVDQPANGSASITGTTLTYTPAAGYHGADSLTYQATGPGGSSQVRTVTITVATPGAPTVQNANLSTPYETAGSVSLTTSGFAPVLSITEQPIHGSAALSGLNVTYTPAAGYYGADTFKVVATNAGGTSAAATVSVTVGNPPAPSLANASLTTAFETTGGVDLSPSGVWSSLEVVSQGTNGTASISGSRLTYEPAAGFYGADTIEVRAVGPGGASAPAMIAVSVAVPGAPSVASASLTTPYETAGWTDLVVSGVFDTLEVVTQGGHGSASISGQRVTFSPNNGHYGADTFTVRAIGPGGASAPATVSVMVGNPPAPIAAPALNLAVAYETAGTVQLQASGVVTGYVLASQPAHGTATLSGGVVTYTPAAGYYGADAFTFRATGPGGNSAPASVSVTVGLPAVPVANAASIATPFETQGTANLSGQGVYSTFQLVSQPKDGTASINSGVATYTPNAGYFGADSFTFTVSGPGGVSTPATVSVAVGVPGRPVASPDSIATDYDTAGSVTLRATGIHDRFAIVAAPTHGQVALAGAAVTYTPNPGYFGADAFTFTAEGPGGVSNPATIAVTVGLPDAPGAANITASTPYETAADIALQPSGVWSSLAVVAQPSSGSVTITGTTARFTPNAGFYGTATWTYRAMGAGGNSDPATVTVTVGLPPAPIAAPALNLAVAYETAGSVQLQASGVVTGYVLASQPAHGTATLSGGVVTYTPAADYYGADAFTFRATGPGGSSAAATVSVAVGLPAVPVANAASIATPFETQGTVNLSGQGVYSTFQLVSQPKDGTASINSGVATYTPNAGYFGADSFTFTVSGPGGASTPATVSVAVGLPGRPVASPDSITTAYETAGSVTLRATGIHDRFAIVAAPTHGQVALAGAAVIYTPNPGYFGADAFTFTAEGPGGVSNPATIAVTVGLPDVPIAAGSLALSVPYETAGTVQLQASGVVSGFALDGQPAHGTATLNGDVVTYTPARGYFGADAFSFSAQGPGGISAAASVTVTVGLPDVPIAAASLALSVPFETAGTVQLQASGVVTGFALGGHPAHGTVTLSGGAVTYTPATGYYGADAFGFVAQGPGGASAEAVVTVTVGNPPIAAIQDLSVTTPMDTAVKIELLQGALYVDGLEVGDGPKNGVVEVDGTTAVYTPAAGYFGADAFTYRLKGPGGLSNEARVSITVDGGPPPEADSLERTGLSGDPIIFDVTAGLEGGPFTGVRLLRDDSIVPADHGGTVRVEGLRVIFTPGPGWTGQASFAFAVENRFGWSQPARLTAIVNPRPVTGPVIEVETWAGQAVEVELTEKATGGPFTGARIVRIDPADKVTVELRDEGGRYTLRVTPQGQFAGSAEIRYTLQNAYAVSDEGLVRVIVKERPDPSRDPEVTGVINAQTQAAYRLGGAQLSNVLRRLEQLHEPGATRNRMGLSLVPIDDRYALPWQRHAPGPNSATYTMIDGRLQEMPKGTPATTTKQCVVAVPTAAATTGAGEQKAFAWWVEGAIDLGFNRKSEHRAGIDFTTDGVTIGADRRLSERLAVGAGIGYGRDVSQVGVKGSEAETVGYSAFAYASWLPRKNLFVDGVVGFTSMDLDSRRFVTQTGDLLASRRSGHQFFGSVAAGYEYRSERLHLSPYGRLEISDITLRAFREHGDELWALEFAEQGSSRVRAALGVRGDYLFEYRSGKLRPNFRLEYHHDLKSGGQAGVRYADWEHSPNYQIELARYDDRNVLMGAGVRWEGTNGRSWAVGYESTVRNETAQQGTLRFDFAVKF